MNSQNQSQSQNQIVPQQAFESVFFTITHEPHWTVTKTIHFLNKIKT